MLLFRTFVFAVCANLVHRKFIFVLSEKVASEVNSDVNNLEWNLLIFVFPSDRSSGGSHSHTFDTLHRKDTKAILLFPDSPSLVRANAHRPVGSLFPSHIKSPQGTITSHLHRHPPVTVTHLCWKMSAINFHHLIHRNTSEHEKLR